MGQKTDRVPKELKELTDKIDDKIDDGADVLGKSADVPDESADVPDESEDPEEFKDYDDCEGFEDFDEDEESGYFDKSDAFGYFDESESLLASDADEDFDEDGAFEDLREEGKSETPEKAEKSEAPEKAEKSEAPEKTEKSEAPEKTEKSEAPEKAEKSEVPEKAEKSEAPEKAEKSEAPEKVKKSKAPEKAGRSKKPEKDEAYGEYDEYDEDDDYDEDEEGGGILNLLTFFVFLIAAAITAVYFTCTVRTVRVTGNTLYTSQQIAEYVISDNTQLRHNSIYLTLLYMTPWAPKIPFVEKVRVVPDSPDSITIRVRDMDIAGYIPYAGKNLYFSADGIVLENSPLTIRNAAFVTGLTITKGEIGSKLEAENQAGLDLVLNALEILRKYDLHTESIYLGKTGGVTMYLDQIKVQLGRTDFELKISKIAQIYPYLEGRSGTINMTNYSSSDENIILK